MDVRRTVDGEWVVFHDPTLKRTTAQSGRLARTSWSRLSLLDAGCWFSPEFAGQRIPRVSEALALCRQRKVRVFLDVKVADGEKELLGVLKKSDWLHQIGIGAGTLPSLRRWRWLDSKGLVFWVTGYRSPITLRRVLLARRLQLTGLVAYKRWVTQASVRRVHEAGLRLYLWTVRNRRELKAFVQLGVDGIMSEVWPPPSI